MQEYDNDAHIRSCIIAVICIVCIVSMPGWASMAPMFPVLTQTKVVSRDSLTSTKLETTLVSDWERRYSPLNIYNQQTRPRPIPFCLDNFRIRYLPLPLLSLERMDLTPVFHHTMARTLPWLLFMALVVPVVDPRDGTIESHYRVVTLVQMRICFMRSM